MTSAIAVLCCVVARRPQGREKGQNNNGTYGYGTRYESSIQLVGAQSAERAERSERGPSHQEDIQQPGGPRLAAGAFHRRIQGMHRAGGHGEIPSESAPGHRQDTRPPGGGPAGERPDGQRGGQAAGGADHHVRRPAHAALPGPPGPVDRRRPDRSAWSSTSKSRKKTIRAIQLNRA